MQLVEFSTDRICYKLAAGFIAKKEKVSLGALMFYLWHNVNIGLKNAILLDHFIRIPLFWAEMVYQDTSLPTAWMMVTHDKDPKYELLMFGFLVYFLSYLALGVYELVRYLRSQNKAGAQRGARSWLARGSFRLGLKLLIQLGWCYFLTEGIDRFDYDSKIMYLLLLTFLCTTVLALFNLILYTTTLFSNNLPPARQNQHLFVSFILLQEVVSFILVMIIL